ncbi:hypothetical protein C2E23DRAFT_530621 [Lenzites betulinus]|nr:hypothetical protein C2E23DRAFT_530621 [Lenzites betulinus]
MRHLQVSPGILRVELNHALGLVFYTHVYVDIIPQEASPLRTPRVRSVVGSKCQTGNYPLSSFASLPRHAMSILFCTMRLPARLDPPRSNRSTEQLEDRHAASISIDTPYKKPLPASPRSLPTLLRTTIIPLPTPFLLPICSPLPPPLSTSTPPPSKSLPSAGRCGPRPPSPVGPRSPVPRSRPCPSSSSSPVRNRRASSPGRPTSGPATASARTSRCSSRSSTGARTTSGS